MKYLTSGFALSHTTSFAKSWCLGINHSPETSEIPKEFAKIAPREEHVDQEESVKAAKM